MRITRRLSQNLSKQKTTTGTTEFNPIANGELFAQSTTVLVSDPDFRKTTFSAQLLAHGLLRCDAPGILVACGEGAILIAASDESFGWQVESMSANRHCFIDAQPTADLIQAGNPDIDGITRVVFDALEVMMALLPNTAAKCRDIYCLHVSLLAKALTGVVTAAADADHAGTLSDVIFKLMQLMVDCVMMLHRRASFAVSQCGLRVQKYGDSSFDEGEALFVTGTQGFDAAVAHSQALLFAKVSSERVSSAIKRHDGLSVGGYYRGSSVLVAELPATTETTFSAAFAQAACLRGEKTVPVCFDSNSAESMLVRIKSAVINLHVRCLMVDPVSIFSKAGNEFTAQRIAECLIDWCKAQGITLFCTNLIETVECQTIANTASHSNQVRKFILSDTGIRSAERYTARGEVQMRMLRWKKARAQCYEIKHAKRQSNLKGARPQAGYTFGASRRRAQMRQKCGANNRKLGLKSR